MSTLSRLRPRMGSAILALALATAAVHAADDPSRREYAGETLGEALHRVQALGLRLIYSSDVVKPWMRVEAEPAPGDPRAVLDELLAPHGLEAREGPGGVLFIVRSGRATPPAIRERIVVRPDRERSARDRPDTGRDVEGDALRATPSIGGDAQRAIAWQAGLASGDRSAAFSVRGGEANEVLILLDGQEIYDPFHLKHFQRFSGIIDSQAVGGARLFSEAFPAEYGDRMSGVVDLSSSVPGTPGSVFVGSGFLNSRLMADGRFGEGPGHWLISGRAWYPDAVVRTTDRENEGFRPSYYDLLGKAQARLGGRNVLTGHFLAARDDVDFTDPDGEESVNAASGTRYAWLTLSTLWSPRLDSRTVVSYGRIRSERTGRIDEDGEFVASVEDGRALSVLGLTQDWTFRPFERLLFKWGISGKRLESAYEYFSRSEAGPPLAEPGGVVPPPERAFDLVASGRQLGGYAAAQFRPLAALTVETGLRWDRQSHTGERQVSPRMGLVRALGPSSRIRAAWGRFYQSQGVHELQIEDGLPEFFPAQLAEHWTVAYEREIAGGWTLRADAYLKRMSGLRPRFENLFNPFELLPEFEPDRVRIEPERGEAKGLDLTLARRAGGPVGWWAAYSRSAVEDVIDGRGVPRGWDQPHAFRFGLDYRRGETLEVGLAGEYHTGWPTTSVGARAVQDADGSVAFEPALGPRNGDRFPPYHRLDLRVGRHFRIGRGRLTIVAEITNLYDRANVCCVEDVELRPQPDGSVRVEREDGLWLPRVPSLGLTWRFEPRVRESRTPTTGSRR